MAFGFFVKILLVTNFAFYGTSRRSYEGFGTCDLLVCHSDKEINIIKADSSVFKRCPKTTDLCFKQGCDVYLNGTSAVFVEEYGVLKILENGTFHFLNDGFCKVTTRSYLKVGKNASLINKGGSLMLSYTSDVNNNGLISIKNNANLYVDQHSTVDVLGSISHDASGSVEFVTNKEAIVELNTESELTLSLHSSLTIGDYTRCEERNRRGRLTLGNKAELNVRTYSQIELSFGEIVVNDGNKVYLDQASVSVDGLLEIDRDFVSLYHMELIIGSIAGNGTYKLCHDDSSLIVSRYIGFTKRLALYAGAHCYTKSIENDINDVVEIELYSTSDTNEFKCFSSRNALFAAVNRTNEIY